MFENFNKKSIFLGSVSFCAYASCYYGRSILSAVMPQMLENTNLNKMQLGYMGSAYLFAYGIGQIINGIIGDKIKAKYMVSVGLFAASLTIFMFPFMGSVISGIFLWALCGFLLSMLWGPLTKVIAENVSPKTGRLLLTLLSVASILGMMLAYLTAMLTSKLGWWKLSFYITAVFLMVTAVLWFIFLHYLESKNLLKKIKSEKANANNNRQLIKILINNEILPMIMVSMINGIIRNAVAFWIPTYVVEKLGASPAMSAGITSILPVINLLGMFAGVFLLSKTKENEHKVSVIMFAIATLLFLILWIINGKFLILSLICLFGASAAMASVCNLIFSSYCIRFRETQRVSTVTGFLNFISYASSAIASTAFISLVSKTGWNSIVFLWTLMTLVGGVFSYLALKNKTFYINRTRKINIQQ